MIVGVPKEIYPGERRVALTPVVVPMLAKAGLDVVIEAGAGMSAGYLDAQYQEKGAKILADRASVFAQFGRAVANLAALAVEGYSEAVRLVADELDEMEHGIVMVEHNRIILLAADVNDFFALSN